MRSPPLRSERGRSRSKRATVDAAAVEGAFGSVDPDIFAKRHLLAPDRVYGDLDRDEMVEPVERIGGADGGEFEPAYWPDCVARSSGNPDISEPIFPRGREPAGAAEIVARAMREAEASVIAPSPPSA